MSATETTPPPETPLNVDETQATEERPKTGVWGFMYKVLGVMDYVGETVVGIFGLDDSKFQYVMDGMDKEDWQKAVAIDRERRLEDAIMDAAEELQEQDAQLRQQEGGDVEGGSDMEEKKIKDYMNLVRDQVTADFWEKEIRENPLLEREVRQVVPDEIAPIARTMEVVTEKEEYVVRSEDVEVTVTSESTTATATVSNMSIEASQTQSESY
mmetsp:Transcript_15636/g.26063  ORF Transcript_15636/g.26063 Transcript_15636/m.26063 type:complete len:212 (-) Transcript_15636:992-1627(-)|eukprot:CAMPEP_0114426484 /NCGR_PEP_ID=MMETSP0103-20121206/7824_1 /TAXON_ID=37642 ORGANISM="Paraphysomonas imperforata, Strain PA2" /NCGR_SAMPLE_ID=MMETSP0103 /ASSEMBLY_ACC=CAM_ASM_000201 /LENGTH=211 /DNA_ID=CAMNT_0001595451 /DNA_START=119 /DNA_END=754 /DNA_ORIENTATION=+